MIVDSKVALTEVSQLLLLLIKLASQKLRSKSIIALLPNHTKIKKGISIPLAIVSFPFMKALTA